MIKKLRRKFILVNMLLVTLVLLIVFGILVGSTYQPDRSELQRPSRGTEVGKRHPASPF